MTGSQGVNDLVHAARLHLHDEFDEPGPGTQGVDNLRQKVKPLAPTLMPNDTNFERSVFPHASPFPGCHVW